MGVNREGGNQHTFHLTGILRSDTFRSRLIVSLLRDQGIFCGASTYLQLLLKYGKVVADHILELQMGLTTLQCLEFHGLVLDGIAPNELLAITFLMNSPINGEFISSDDNIEKGGKVSRMIGGDSTVNFEASVKDKMLAVSRELMELAEEKEFVEAFNFTSTIRRDSTMYKLTATQFVFLFFDTMAGLFRLKVDDEAPGVSSEEEEGEYDY
ncbi:hypothetical protein TrRE_jg11052 [Triparma retinervis]|uniref:Uncharacterized protein n=1 Tax=Triparma retinervis TaxID=2557542 RepID=A0A9W7L4K2_9STRA|nr:hypothetical protein TrRE_jg11052 [Triparma retinervis]